MKKKVLNEIKLILFCLVIGAVAGILFWLFLFVVSKGTWLLWDLIPEKLLPYWWYPLLACTAGGLLIGLFRKKFGNYPQDMMTVFGVLKKTKTYPYRKILILIVSAILPLIFAASVGPEAGMVGIIVALCCWAGDNLKFAGKQSAFYSKVGASVTLSVMFRSPLFGLLHAEEGEEEENEAEISKITKIIIYCIAAGGGFGCFYLLNLIFGKISEGFPTFDRITTNVSDYLMFLPYVIIGILLGLFFLYSEKLMELLAKKIPPVLSEVIAGAVLGGVACVLPVVRFSGEEQMGVLISDYALYAPLAMIGIAFLKIVMTSLCIQFGLKGGHFFPLIFGAVSLGYGVSLLIFPGESSHAVFAAAVICASTLAVTMKKPLAVAMLMLLCFPLRMLIWIVPAAAVAAYVGKLLSKKKEEPRQIAEESQPDSARPETAEAEKKTDPEKAG